MAPSRIAIRFSCCVASPAILLPSWAFFDPPPPRLCASSGTGLATSTSNRQGSRTWTRWHSIKRDVLQDATNTAPPSDSAGLLSNLPIHPHIRLQSSSGKTPIHHRHLLYISQHALQAPRHSLPHSPRPAAGCNRDGSANPRQHGLAPAASTGIQAGSDAGRAACQSRKAGWTLSATRKTPGSRPFPARQSGQGCVLRAAQDQGRQPEACSQHCKLCRCSRPSRCRGRQYCRRSVCVSQECACMTSLQNTG